MGGDSDLEVQFWGKCACCPVVSAVFLYAVHSKGDQRGVLMKRFCFQCRSIVIQRHFDISTVSLIPTAVSQGCSEQTVLLYTPHSDLVRFASMADAVTIQYFLSPLWIVMVGHCRISHGSSSVPCIMLNSVSHPPPSLASNRPFLGGPLRLLRKIPTH